MVRTGFGSGNWDGIAGGAPADGTTSGGSPEPFRAASPLTSAVWTGGATGAGAWAAAGAGAVVFTTGMSGAGGGGAAGFVAAVWAARSTGCSSLVTILTGPDLPLSLSRLAPSF